MFILSILNVLDTIPYMNEEKRTRVFGKNILNYYMSGEWQLLC